MLDVCPVRVGSFTLFGPVVQIYTATHPFDAGLRRKEEFGKPVEIGADVRTRAGAGLLRREGPTRAEQPGGSG